MPFIKNPYNILIEAAGSDLTANTEGLLTEQSILSRMDSIEELSESFVHSAESVPVFQNGNDLLVEMTGIAGFMQDAGIYNVEEALDAVAAANDLPAKSVGLLVESDSYVQAMLEKACKKGKSAKNKTLEKINAAGKIADKLKDKGYNVKKKCSKDECAKAECGVNEVKAEIKAGIKQQNNYNRSSSTYRNDLSTHEEDKIKKEYMKRDKDAGGDPARPPMKNAYDYVDRTKIANMDSRNYDADDAKRDANRAANKKAASKKESAIFDFNMK